MPAKFLISKPFFFSYVTSLISALVITPTGFSLDDITSNQVTQSTSHINGKITTWLVMYIQGLVPVCVCVHVCECVCACGVSVCKCECVCV